MSLRENLTLKYSPLKAGITIGDPSGIGPAITLLASHRLRKIFDLTVIGDKFVLAKAAGLLGKKIPQLRLIDLANIDRRRFSFGRIAAEYGRASLEYLEAALELLGKRQIDCLVTCPISKEAVGLSGAGPCGHTEYLARKTGASNTVMMLMNSRFKFSLLSRHLALKDVSASISSKSIRDNLRLTLSGLRRYFLIKKPRLAVCGLNPHASDNGLFGREEKEIIAPAVRRLRSEFKDAYLEGPLPADAAIYRAARGEFDCLLAIYHDQALIPLKLTDFESGVNLTLGLPFVRTSPLHGTAFDIACRPLSADPQPLISAVKAAVKCALNQRRA